MKFSTALVINLAAVAGYMAARTLLEDDTDLERLPNAARHPLEHARGRLQRARTRAQHALMEARIERTAAERDLMAQYRSRTRP
ncbi:MAG: hypothetical protein EPO65_01090 [Dehalococcoidia bacterium]|nr:MAG: hypothetical protein EPO65_01090 [Dehalococcoidia bacterium]